MFAAQALPLIVTAPRGARGRLDCDLGLEQRRWDVAVGQQNKGVDDFGTRRAASFHIRDVLSQI